MLIALGGLVAASAVAVGSGANFNASSANPSSFVSAGTIVVTDSLAGQSILNVNPIKPGGSTSATVNIQNGGTVPAGFTLAKANLVDTPASPALSSNLTLVVQDLGDPTCTVSCPGGRNHVLRNARSDGNSWRWERSPPAPSTNTSSV